MSRKKIFSPSTISNLLRICIAAPFVTVLYSYKSKWCIRGEEIPIFSPSFPHWITSPWCCWIPSANQAYGRDFNQRGEGGRNNFVWLASQLTGMVVVGRLMRSKRPFDYSQLTQLHFLRLGMCQVLFSITLLCFFSLRNEKVFFRSNDWYWQPCAAYSLDYTKLRKSRDFVVIIIWWDYFRKRF